MSTCDVHVLLVAEDACFNGYRGQIWIMGDRLMVGEDHADGAVGQDERGPTRKPKMD